MQETHHQKKTAAPVMTDPMERKERDLVEVNPPCFLWFSSLRDALRLLAQDLLSSLQMSDPDPLYAECRAWAGWAGSLQALASAGAVKVPAHLSLSMATLSLDPLAWGALGVMLASSAIIAARADKYEGEEQEIARGASTVLLASSATQLGVCVVEALHHMQPLALSLHISSPFLAARFVQDAIILPIWLRILGSAAKQPTVTDRACKFSVVGVLCQGGAAIWADHLPVVGSLLIPATVCISAASFHVLQRFEAVGSPKRSEELRLSGILLSLYMLFSGFIEVLGISHAASEPQMLMEYAVLDVLAKVTSCHLLTKSMGLPPVSGPSAAQRHNFEHVPRLREEEAWNSLGELRAALEEAEAERQRSEELSPPQLSP